MTRATAVVPASNVRADRSAPAHCATIERRAGPETVGRPVRESFFYGRHFVNDADLNARALSWLERTANVRTHRTTAEVPRVRFERDERVLLKPLAPRPYRSLVLAPTAAPAGKPAYPPLTVERRPLAWHDRLARAAR